jgi:hypothetical protein
MGKVMDKVKPGGLLAYSYQTFKKKKKKKRPFADVPFAAEAIRLHVSSAFARFLSAASAPSC